LTTDFKLKICDFNSSKKISHIRSKAARKKDGIPNADKPNVGTLLYTSPEVISNEVQSYPVDIWSLGIIIYELMVGITPFYDAKAPNMKEKILHKNPALVEGNYSSTLKNIVMKMIQKKSCR
jgi:serine/threonine protein kinase